MTSARLGCSLLQLKAQSSRRSSEGVIPLALPLIRQLQMGQVYFGDPSKGGSTLTTARHVIG
jgi:hypothetical protein